MGQDQENQYRDQDLRCQGEESCNPFQECKETVKMGIVQSIRRTVSAVRGAPDKSLIDEEIERREKLSKYKMRKQAWAEKIKKIRSSVQRSRGVIKQSVERSVDSAERTGSRLQQVGNAFSRGKAHLKKKVALQKGPDLFPKSQTYDKTFSDDRPRFL